MLDNPLTDTAYITGFDLELDNAPVVHHTLLIRDHGKNAGVGYGVTDTSAGFDCRDPILELDIHGPQSFEIPAGETPRASARAAWSKATTTSTTS